MDKLLTVNEVAEILSVHPKSVYRWVYEGRLDSCKVGGRRRFAEENVKKFIKSGKA